MEEFLGSIGSKEALSKTDGRTLLLIEVIFAIKKGYPMVHCNIGKLYAKNQCFNSRDNTVISLVSFSRRNRHYGLVVMEV